MLTYRLYRFELYLIASKFLEIIWLVLLIVHTKNEHSSFEIVLAM